MGLWASKSKYGYFSTAEQVAEGVDLTGKNVIVTGSNTGIGLETVRIMAKCGAFIIMACRDMEKTQKAIERVKEENPDAKLQAMQLNLASLESIRKFASEFNKLNIPLHILINNAGVMACPYGKTDDGFEMQLGTNHLGHFLLTNLLIPRLKEGAPARVVVVSSLGHMGGGINWEDMQFEKGYSAWKAYFQSKTANILFAQEMNKRYSADGIFTNSLHPGVIGATELARHLYVGVLSKITIATTVAEYIGIIKSIPSGAATQVYVATAEELEQKGGLYFSDCQQSTPSAHATDAKFAERLWEESVKLVGLDKK